MMIGVGILGGTGAVGQQLVALLDGHPQFHLAVIGASDRSAGQRYDNACVWRQTSPLAAEVASMIVVECIPENFVGKCALVFSALGTDIAGELEVRFAKAGIKDPDVPLIVPYVNPEHVELVKSQSFGGGGWIVTNANCSTTGLVVALKPLQDKFGISECMVTTLQAISGAGYTGIYAMDIADNVVPYIGNEEDKLETEPQKILGHIVGGKTEHLTSLRMSAQCNRVNVSDGHTICVSVKLINDPQDPAVVEAALRDFQPNLPANLPSLPPKSLVL